MLISIDDAGLTLPGCGLWFDAQKPRPWCVLLGLGSKRPPRHARAITGLVLAKHLEALGYRGSILPVPYTQWMVAAGQRLMLVGAHGELGGAAALVESRHGSVLIAGALRRTRVQWPKAEHWVVRASALEHSGGSIQQVCASVLRFAQTAWANNQRAHIWVDDLESGLLLAQALGESGEKPHVLGLLQKLHANLLAPNRRLRLSLVPSAGTGLPTKDAIGWVNTGVRCITTFHTPPQQVFNLSWYADRATLTEGLKQSQAAHLWLAGPDGALGSERLQTLRAAWPTVQVHALHPAAQLALMGPGRS